MSQLNERLRIAWNERVVRAVCATILSVSRRVLRMSAESVLARVWAPGTLTVVSTVPVGFAINFLTSGAAEWWWWLVLGVGVVAGIVGGVLTTLGVKRERSSRACPSVQGGAVGQQTASDSGTNISINAEHGSVAAYQMGEVHIGRPRRRGKRKES